MSEEAIGTEVGMYLGNGKCSLHITLMVWQKKTKEEFCQSVRELLEEFSKSDALESIWEKGQGIITKAQIDSLTSDISKGA